MSIDSLSATPSAPVIDVRSDPAKSTSCNLLVVIDPDGSIISTINVNKLCESEDAKFKL